MLCYGAMPYSSKFQTLFQTLVLIVAIVKFNRPIGK